MFLAIDVVVFATDLAVFLVIDVVVFGPVWRQGLLFWRVCKRLVFIEG